MITFGSLFAGIGGIDLGLERAGKRYAWQVGQDEPTPEGERRLHAAWLAKKKEIDGGAA